MNNGNTIKGLLTQFLGQQRTISISVAMIDVTGDHLSALLLSQIIYWSDRTDDPDGWFAKTYDDWYKELRITKKQAIRIISGLKDLGLETQVKKSPFYQWQPVVHYRLDWQVLIKKVAETLLKSRKGTSESDERELSESDERELSMESDERELPYNIDDTEMTIIESPSRLDDDFLSLFPVEVLIGEDAEADPEEEHWIYTRLGMLKKSELSQTQKKKLAGVVRHKNEDNSVTEYPSVINMAEVHGSAFEAYFDEAVKVWEQVQQSYAKDPWNSNGITNFIGFLQNYHADRKMLNGFLRWMPIHKKFNPPAPKEMTEEELIASYSPELRASLVEKKSGPIDWDNVDFSTLDWGTEESND